MFCELHAHSDNGLKISLHHINSNKSKRLFYVVRSSRVLSYKPPFSWCYFINTINRFYHTLVNYPHWATSHTSVIHKVSTRPIDYTLRNPNLARDTNTVRHTRSALPYHIIIREITTIQVIRRRTNHAIIDHHYMDIDVCDLIL